MIVVFNPDMVSVWEYACLDSVCLSLTDVKLDSFTELTDVEVIKDVRDSDGKICIKVVLKTVIEAMVLLNKESFLKEVGCCFVDSRYLLVSTGKLDVFWGFKDVKGFKDEEDSEFEAVMMELFLNIRVSICWVVNSVSLFFSEAEDKDDISKLFEVGFKDE